MFPFKCLAPSVLCAVTVAMLGLPAASAADMTREQCLQCHGPVGQLAGKDIKFPVDGGTVNPHRFIPHGETVVEKFPVCTVCHKPHPMPPPKGFKDKEANVEMCYSCHHQYTFQPCKECHK